MHVPRITAAIAVGALVFAGCGGGDDSNKKLSYSEFGTKASEVCTSANGDIKQISSKLTGDPKNDAPLLGQLIPKLEDADKKFKELTPPDELKADFDEFNSITEQQISVTKEAKSLAESGDQAGYQAKIQELQSLGSKSDVNASKLGAKACISGNS
jgi:hypothetical protein